MSMDEKSIEFKKGAYGRFLDTELESIFSQSCIHSDQGCSIAVEMSDGGFDIRVIWLASVRSLIGRKVVGKLTYCNNAFGVKVPYHCAKLYILLADVHIDSGYLVVLMEGSESRIFAWYLRHHYIPSTTVLGDKTNCASWTTMLARSHSPFEICGLNNLRYQMLPIADIYCLTDNSRCTNCYSHGHNTFCSSQIADNL